MYVELNILFTISFFEHSVIKDVSNLRYLSWSVHNWNILLNPQWPLWRRGGLLDHGLHCDRVSPEVLRLQGLIDYRRTPYCSWLMATCSAAPTKHNVAGDSI